MNTPNAENIPNHLVWSILATLFCCLPLGIVSIVYAAQVDGRRLAGDAQGAHDFSHKAKMWAIYAALIGPACFVLWIMAFGGLAALGSLSGYH